MGFTGILMMNPLESMKYFPLGMIQISGLLHTWEAVLASIAIFIGHLFDEHFAKYPNWSWLTGNVSEEEMKHEHSLEYEAAISDYKSKNCIKEVIRDKSEESIVRYKVITVLSKTAFTMFFLIVCIWMLWISYNTLMDAVTHYVI